MTTTGKLIRQEMVNRGILLMIGEADEDNNDTSYLTDIIRLQSTRFSSSQFDGCMVRFASDTSGDLAAENNADYRIRQVDYLDQDNGRLYLTPAMPDAASLDGMVYEIWRAGVDPMDVDRMRDKALTSLCNVWKTIPLCIIPDGDMEKAGVTDWTGSATETITKTTLSYPSEYARRILSVDNNGVADGYAQTATMNIEPGRTVYYKIPVAVTTGTATFDLRDITNGDSLASWTATGAYWGYKYGSVSVPSNCSQIAIRLGGEGANDVSLWGPIAFYPTNHTRFYLPDRVVSRGNVGEFFDVSGDWGEEVKNQLADSVERERVADNVQVTLQNPAGTDSIYYKELSYYDTLSTSYLGAGTGDNFEEVVRELRQTGDLATTNCPLDYAAAGTAKLLAELQMQKYPEEAEYWAGVLTLANRDLTRWDLEFGAEPKIVHDNERNILLPFYEV